MVSWENLFKSPTQAVVNICTQLSDPSPYMYRLSLWRLWILMVGGEGGWGGGGNKHTIMSMDLYVLVVGAGREWVRGLTNSFRYFHYWTIAFPGPKTL